MLFLNPIFISFHFSSSYHTRINHLSLVSIRSSLRFISRAIIVMLIHLIYLLCIYFLRGKTVNIDVRSAVFNIESRSVPFWYTKEDCRLRLTSIQNCKLNISLSTEISMNIINLLRTPRTRAIQLQYSSAYKHAMQPSQQVTITLCQML